MKTYRVPNFELAHGHLGSSTIYLTHGHQHGVSKLYLEHGHPRGSKFYLAHDTYGAVNILSCTWSYRVSKFSLAHGHLAGSRNWTSTWTPRGVQHFIWHADTWGGSKHFRTHGHLGGLKAAPSIWTSRVAGQTFTGHMGTLGVQNLI